MTKITLSVCKVFKNTGSFRFHRKKTKKHWKHYFIDLEDETFGTEWISNIKAMILKLKKRHKRMCICLNCGRIFYAYIKNEREEVKCPICPDDEDE